MNQNSVDEEVLQCPACGDVLFQSMLLNDNCSCVCTACGERYPHPDVKDDVPAGLKWISPKCFPSYYLGMTVYAKLPNGSIWRVYRQSFFESAVWFEAQNGDPISFEDEPIAWSSDDRYFWSAVDKTCYQICDLYHNREVCVVNEIDGSNDAFDRAMHLTRLLNQTPKDLKDWLDEAIVSNS